MVFGDSNACRPGYGRHCWPAMLQRNSGNRLRVINESVDGRTTRYDVGECNGLVVVEEKIEKSSPLEFVLIALGTNDVKTKYGHPDAADVVDGLDKIVSIVKSGNSGARPILLTPPPLGNVTSGDLAGAQDRIPPVVQEYRRYATTQHIPIIDLYSVMDADTDLEPDGVHLNTSGRSRVAGIVRGNLLSLRAEPPGFLTSK